MVRASRAAPAVKRRCASIAEETRRAPRSRANSPRRRARSCSVRAIVFTPFHPSVETARKEEGENPRAFNQIETKPPGRWGNARRANAPAPQSKPVVQASRLVTQNASSVALGLGVRIRAAGPAHPPLYSHPDRLRAPTSKLLRLVPGPSADSRLPPGSTPTDHARPRITQPHRDPSRPQSRIRRSSKETPTPRRSRPREACSLPRSAQRDRPSAPVA